MPEPLTKKVLLIGWDAADWKVITPLMDAGEMPNLARLVSGGVMGNLSTLYPVLSPMLWTSIATGKRAHKHGIHGFSEPDPQTGGVRPVTNLGRRTKALWNVFHQQGMTSNVVAWWPSFPAEPIRGVMIGNHYQQAPSKPPSAGWPMRPGMVHPERLRRPLAELRIHPAELEAEQLLPFVPRAAEVDQEKDRRLFSVAKILAETASVHAAATATMQLEPWDFMAVYFDGIDHFCHGFMKYHPPRLPWIPEADYELYQDVVAAGYRFHDMMLGTYMKLAGDDTTIVLVSDHGFHPDHLRPRELPNEPAGPADEHRAFGVIAMSGPGVKRDELVFGATLLDVAPTILALYGLPVGRDMDGRPLVAALEGEPEVEWIESWDAVPGDAGTHPPDVRADPVDAQEALEQLVELGYIEEPDEDRATAVANTVRELKYNLARDLMDARRFVEAIPVLEALWRDFPDESRFGLKLMDCHLALGRTEESRRTLERVAREKERYAAEARQELERRQAELAAEEKKPEDLEERERRRLHTLRRKASTNRTTFHYLRGRLLHAEGRHEEALAELARAEGVQTHNLPSLYQRMGEVLVHVGRWDEAAERFRKILEIDPINAGAHLGLAQCHLGRGRPKAALDEALAAAGLVYHSPRAHYLCGAALRRLGREGEAIRALRTAVAQNPVFPDAHRELHTLFARRGEMDEAARHAELAEASVRRLADFREGRVLPTPAEVEAEIDLVAPATLGAVFAGDPLERPPEAVVVVSGLPRSGTSMMMQMLEAGGLAPLTDGVRAADASNRRGYYELEAVKSLGRGRDHAWLDEAAGRTVKVVAPLLPALPRDRPYRIVFMERPLGEIVASQRAMLDRLGRAGERAASRSSNRLALSYRRQIEQVRRLLEAAPDSVRALSVGYGDALEDPAGVARLVNAFLGGGLDERAMAASVDPSLRRERVA